MRAAWLVVAVLAGCAPASHVPADAAADAPPRVDCEALEVELRAELDAIAACTADDECGRAIAEECGCRVARSDADDARFRELADRMRAACPGFPSRVLDRDCACPAPEPAALRCHEGRCVRAYEGHDCFYDQQPRRVGESFPSTDGVNTCNCAMHEVPVVGCTLLL